MSWSRVTATPRLARPVGRLDAEQATADDDGAAAGPGGAEGLHVG
jgi:hypothetical protein